MVLYLYFPLECSHSGLLKIQFTNKKTVSFSQHEKSICRVYKRFFEWKKQLIPPGIFLPQNFIIATIQQKWTFYSIQYGMLAESLLKYMWNRFIHQTSILISLSPSFHFTRIIDKDLEVIISMVKDNRFWL